MTKVEKMRRIEGCVGAQYYPPLASDGAPAQFIATFANERIAKSHLSEILAIAGSRFSFQEIADIGGDAGIVLEGPEIK